MPKMVFPIVGLLLGLVIGCSPVQAKDLYFKAVIGIEWSKDANFRDDSCSATNPAALFGCGAGSNGQSLGAYGDFGSFPVVEGAIGWQALPWFRPELSLTYRSNMNYSGQANFLRVPGDQPVSALADSKALMVNLYLDLAGLTSWNLGPFRPYLGGGAGLAYNRLGKGTYNFPGLRVHKVTITPSGERACPAFMAALGTGIVLSSKMMLDVAFRYTDLGKVGTDPGIAYMNHIPSGIAIAGTWAPLRTFGLVMGLRLLF